jgi:hypothetical protein
VLFLIFACVTYKDGISTRFMSANVGNFPPGRLSFERIPCARVQLWRTASLRM